MQELLVLTGIAGSIAVGAMSPGPSFLMVARTAVASSRSAGLAAAAGMGVGGVCFAIAALAGLQAVFVAVPALFLAMKVLGGLYLVYLGVRIWRGAAAPLDASSACEQDSQPTPLRTFAVATVTQLSNPKAAIIYASVFAAFLPPDFSLALAGGTVATLFCVEAGWYAVVALVLSSAKPRAAYMQFKGIIDRCAGGVMALLGIKLVATAR